MIDGNAMELEPWLVVLGNPPDTTLALWRIAARNEDSIAIFSTRDLAQVYAAEHCSPPFELLQLEQSGLIRVFSDCFRQGLQFASLNPSDSNAQQIFVLRDVLKAARDMLAKSRDQSMG